MTSNVKILIVFLILIVFSPWFTILIRNWEQLSLRDLKFINYSQNIDQINKLQGQSREHGLGLLGRMVINKHVLFGKEIIIRYLQSFDADFLFFKGDLNPLKSTRSHGVLYISFLPLILVGLSEIFRRRDRVNKFIILAFTLSPLLAGFIEPHYELLSRLPFVIVLTYIAASGFLRLYKLRRLYLILFLMLFIFETVNFYQYIYFHYPRKLQEAGFTK